jgi:hypothetical protein
MAAVLIVVKVCRCEKSLILCTEDLGLRYKPGSGKDKALRFAGERTLTSTQECRAEWPTGEITTCGYFEMSIS